MEYRLILFFMLLCFCSCEQASYSYLEVYNSSSEEVSVRVNNYEYFIPAMDKQKVLSKTRETILEFKEEKQLIKTKENERFFINLFRDTIIKEEVLFGRALSYDPERLIEGSTLHQVVKLRDNKYYLAAEVFTDKLVTRYYDFSIGEDVPDKNSSSDEMFKSKPYRKDWAGYYKLYTVDELIGKKIPLNNSDKFIDPMMRGLTNILNPDYSLEVKNQWIKINRKGTNVGHIGSARVSNENILELSRAQLYNETEDGAIKDVIAQIPICHIFIQGQLVNKEVALDIVICDKTPNPRLVIRQN